MRIILNDYLQYCLSRVNITGSMSCFFHAIRTIASYYSSTLIDEVKCAIVMHALNIKYVENEYVGYDFFDEANFDGMEFIQNQTENDLKFVTRSLSKGFPVISFVDSATLTYHNIYKQNRGELHAVIIYGIDLLRNTLFVYDPHIRINDQNFDSFHGEIHMSSFTNLGKMLAIVKKPYFFNTDIMFTTLTKDLRNFNDCYNNRGFCALTRLVEDCSKLIILTKIDEFNEMCMRLNYDIKLNGPCYINNYAISISRLFYHPYVEDIALLNRDWINKCNILLYFSQGRIRNLEGTVSDLENLIKREESLLLRLEDYYGGIINGNRL